MPEDVCALCVSEDTKIAGSQYHPQNMTQWPNYLLLCLASFFFQLILWQCHACMQYVPITLTIPTLSYPPSTPLPTIMSFWVLTLFCDLLSLARATTWAWVWNCLWSMTNSLMAPSLNTMSPPQLVSTNCQWLPRKRLVILMILPSFNHSRSWGSSI